MDAAPVGSILAAAQKAALDQRFHRHRDIALGQHAQLYDVPRGIQAGIVAQKGEHIKFRLGKAVLLADTPAQAVVLLQNIAKPHQDFGIFGHAVSFSSKVVLFKNGLLK